MAGTSGFAARLKRAAVFTTIVWGVAASYVAFEVAMLRGMNLVLAYPGLFGGVTLSRAVTHSTTCLAGPSDDGGREQPGARAGSFALGVAVGHEAVFRQWAVKTPDVVQPLTAEVQQAADGLGVASPGSFAPARLAEANREFVEWVEADPAGTARDLAAQYSPQACQAYKLGTMWGYSEVVRMALPAERAAMGTEIRFYARQLAVPDELWRPLIEPSASPAGSEALEQEMASARARLAAFLGSGSG